jgi:transposase
MVRVPRKTRASPKKVALKIKLVSHLKAKGMKPREIAVRLNMTRQMVYTYLKRVG